MEKTHSPQIRAQNQSQFAPQPSSFEGRQDQTEMTIGQKLERLTSSYLEPQPSLSLSRYLSMNWEPYANQTLPPLHRGSSTINTLAWNHTGSHLLTAGRDTTIRIYSVSNQSMLKASEFKGHTSQVNCVAFNPRSESQFASVSNDRSFRVWDTRQPKPVHVEKTKEEIINCVYSPTCAGAADSSMFATCNYQEELNFYDTRTWKLKKQIKYKQVVSSITWDREGYLFFVSDITGKISVFDGLFPQQQPLTQLSGQHQNGHCECIKIHPDNQTMVSGGQDSLIAFWDIQDFVPKGTISNNDYQVRLMDFSPSGDYLAAIFYDEIQKEWYVEVFDVQARVPLAAPYGSNYDKRCLAWHPDKDLPILALGGECAKEQGVVHLIQLNKNNQS